VTVLKNRVLRIVLSALFCFIHGVALPTLMQIRQAHAEEIEAAQKVAAELKDRLPRDAFDPTALLRKLGAGAAVETLFALVRDKTSLVPYRGALRGSRGTLMDGSGNSLDRALLLGELLRVNGRSVRIANGTLTEAAARTLLDELATSPHPAKTDSLETDLAAAKTILDAVGNETGVVTVPVAQAATETFTSLRERRAGVISTIQAQSGALLKAMRMPPQDVGDEFGRQIELLRSHWWVQYRDAAGNWLDLDPSRPHAAMGETLTAADRVYPVDPAKPIELSLSPTVTCYDADQVCLTDEAPFHRLRVAVVIEQWHPEGLSEQTVLEATVIPALALEQSISVRIVPLAWPSDAANDTAEAVTARLATIKEWRPYLVIGDKATPGRSFDDKGFLTGSDPGQAATNSGLFNGPLDRLNRALSGGGQFTAAWIDYTITSFDRPEYTVRREIFDLIGPETRSAGVTSEPRITAEQEQTRSLALSQSVAILPMVGWLSPAFIIQRQAAEFAVAGKAFAAGPPFARQLGGFAALATTPLYALAYARHFWSENPDDLYLGSINVLTTHAGSARTANGISSQLSFDVVNNQVEVRSGAAIDKRGARLSQGVADTVAEALLMTPASPHANAAVAFAASGVNNPAWRIVDQLSDLPSIQVNADVRSRLALALDQHMIAVVPERPVTSPDGEIFAWWQIDPTRGTTLGIDSRGWGADTSEYPAALSVPLSSQQAGVVTASEGAAVEGNLEYIILAAFVTVCAWLDPLADLSKTIKDLKSSKGLCISTGNQSRSASIGDSVPQVNGE
jgi:hypothetical protein